MVLVSRLRWSHNGIEARTGGILARMFCGSFLGFGFIGSNTQGLGFRVQVLETIGPYQGVLDCPWTFYKYLKSLRLHVPKMGILMP